MDFLGVLFAGLSLYFGAVYFLHGILAKNPASRQRALNRLHTPLFGRLYRNTLRNGLAWLAKLFGGRRPNSLAALRVCFALSLLYGVTLFLLSWTSGGSGTIGTTPILPANTSVWQRIAIALLTAIPACYIFFVLRNLRAIAEEIRKSMIKPLLPLGWSNGATAKITANILVVILVIGGTAGTVDIVNSVGGITTVALAGAIAVAAVLLEGKASAVVGGIAGSALFVSGTIDPFTSGVITALLFWLLLPALNALLDWFSWWISRSLGHRILLTKNLWLTIPAHALINLVAAVALLAVLTITLVTTLEGFNLWAASHGSAPPLALEGLIDTVREKPFGAEGAWITLMLLSTLLPTALHLGMLFMGFAAIHEPKGLRDAVARNLEGEPTQIQLIGPAIYLTAMPMIGLALAGLAFWGAFVFLSTMGAPVTDGLAELALGTIGWVRGF